MKRTRSNVLALASLAALALQGCGDEHASTALVDPARFPATEASADPRAILVVDDDRGDCPHADFNSIQAAVLAAQPGDKILVCRGVYPENVLVEKADLRIEAQGAPGDVVLQGPTTMPYGFQVRNTTGVLVQGFTVQGYADANIIIDGGSGNTLRKNVSTAGVVDGIEVMNSSQNVIEHNISFANAAPNADGIFVWRNLIVNPLGDASDNIIRHNETFNNGQHGINLFQAGAGNVLFGNRSHHNRVRGIQIGQQSNGNTIENNHVFANGLTPPVPNPSGIGIGIFIGNSVGITIRGNRSDDNGSSGIALMGSSGSVVSNNRSGGNTMAGIALNASSNNLVDRNEVSGNGLDGIRILNNADGNVVRLNHVFRHGRDGVRVDAASDRNTLERNVIADSGEHDAHDDSLGPGTAGTANFWLKNHCETESPPGLCDRASRLSSGSPGN